MSQNGNATKGSTDKKFLVGNEIAWAAWKGAGDLLYYVWGLTSACVNDAKMW